MPPNNKGSEWKERIEKSFKGLHFTNTLQELIGDNVMEIFALRLKDEFEQELQNARRERDEKIIKLLDWKNSPDVDNLHSGSQVVEWIENKLNSLQQE